MAAHRETTSSSANLPARIDNARRLLMQAKSIDDLTSVRDQAKALQRLTRGVAAARDAHNECGEIVILCLAREGEELAKMEKARGTEGSGRPGKGGRTRRPPNDDAPTLKELGISKDESSRAQKIASIPKAKLQAHLDEVKESGGEITTAGVVRLANKDKGKPKSKATKLKASPVDAAPAAEYVPLYEQVFDTPASKDTVCMQTCQQLIAGCCQHYLPKERWAELFDDLRLMLDTLEEDLRVDRRRAAAGGIRR